MITDRAGILSRWAEHFNSVLNQISEFDDSMVNEIPDWEVDDNLMIPPDDTEVARAISQLFSGKAAGVDGLSPELFKIESRCISGEVDYTMFSNIWSDRSVPQDFKDATIMHIFKRKGDRSVCDNHRGISLLSVPGKIVARVILNRLTKHVSDRDILPESQCGFRAGRSTMDMVFTARQLQEKCREHQCDLYAVFGDLTKAFDTVNRSALWKILRKLVVQVVSSILSVPFMMECGSVSSKEKRNLSNLM